MLKIIFSLALALLFSTNALIAATAEEIFITKSPICIGIISAVPGESGRLLELMERPVSQERGMRTYFKGKLFGIDTVLVSSRIGKVAAAATATHLIIDYHVDMILFTGVAGAIDNSLQVGDIVIASSLMQHDMDASPFCPVYEIPLLKITRLAPDPFLQKLALNASEQFATCGLQNNIPKHIQHAFQIFQPKVKEGLILTGDQVISQEVHKRQLKEQIPDALCVEMEGASVGQVCYEYGVPYAIIRIISDYANHEHTPIDVKKFVQQVSGYYSVAIIENIYSYIKKNSENRIEIVNN